MTDPAANQSAREPAEPDIAKNIGVLQAENEALRRELAEAKQDRDHWREMAMRSQFQRPFFDGSCFACGEKHGGLACPRTVPTAAGFPRSSRVSTTNAGEVLSYGS